MDPRFPIGASLADGAFVVEERIRGEVTRGLYRGRDRAASSGSVLVTIGTGQQRPFRDTARDLSLPVDGIARLRHVGPLAEDPSFHALVEDEPAGAPSSERARRLAPRAAVSLALEVGRVLVNARAARWELPHLRPELVYVLEQGGRVKMTAIAPRAEPFLAGAAPASPGVPPLFEAIYAAPEVLALAPPSGKADVFALCGCLAYWATGEPPFQGDTPLGQLTALHKGARRPFGGPAELAAVLAAGLELDPARRLTLSALMEELARLVVSEGLR
ncbi:MAG TPA: hypothetical protein VKZ63_20215 [Kofleriaceae bacterium]|nr:hypothetical protein [Kofleriaceae bacterium]